MGNLFGNHFITKAVALTLGVAAFSAAADAQQVIKLTVIAGHPPATAGVANLSKVFIPEIDKALAADGKYKIEWTQAYGGTVAKPPAVFEAVESGIGDIGYVPTLFEADKLPLEQISYVAPFGSTDATKIIEVMKKLREQIPEMNQAFARHRQVYLASVSIDNYQIISKEPIPNLAALKGRKLGAPGLAANWIRNTGAVPVAGNLTEYFNSMKTGVYDGVIVFESAIRGYRFHEVAPYINKVDIGATYASAVTMNAPRFNRLPKPVQAAIVRAGQVYEQAVNKETLETAKTAVAVVVKEGAKVITWPEEDRRKLAAAIPNFAKTWAAELDKKKLPGTKLLNTYMELSRAASVQHARAWDKE